MDLTMEDECRITDRSTAPQVPAEHKQQDNEDISKQDRVEACHILIGLCKQEFRDYGEAIRGLFRIARRGWLPWAERTFTREQVWEAVHGAWKEWFTNDENISTLVIARLTAPEKPDPAVKAARAVPLDEILRDSNNPCYYLSGDGAKAVVAAVDEARKADREGAL
jgi:hypothetical protein